MTTRDAPALSSSVVETAVILGPGQHGARVLAALRSEGVGYRAVRSWPRFETEELRPGEAPKIVETGQFFDHFSNAAWALWRRLPRLGRSEAPRAALEVLFSHLAARRISNRASNLIVAFSQVALPALNYARARGIRTILEHPTSHVRAWSVDVEEERRRWGSRSVPLYSAWPRMLCDRMERECAEAERVVVLSSFARGTFEEAGFPKEKLVTVPLGVDCDLFHPEARGDRPFRILFVGRLELMKGLPYLLQAVAGLKHVELWLVGRVLPEAEALLASLAGSNVRCMGVVPSSALPTIYRRCDVFVFPTLNDAFGLVVLEAMASGIPVIATRRCVGADAITDGKEGFLVPERDHRALTDMISRLRDRPRERSEMGELARRRVVDEFSWERYAQRMLAAYGVRA